MPVSIVLLGMRFTPTLPRRDSAAVRQALCDQMSLMEGARSILHNWPITEQFSASIRGSEPAIATCF